MAHAASPDSTESRSLSDLHNTVTDLAIQLETTTADLTHHRDVTERHLDALTTVCEQFNTRLAAVEQRPNLTPADVDEAALATWVDGWLIPVFDLGVALSGWADHPSYVSELTAAWKGHQHITSEAAAPFDGMVWHGYLAAAVDRIRTYHRNTASPEVLDLITARSHGGPPPNPFQGTTIQSTRSEEQQSWKQ